MHPQFIKLKKKYTTHKENEYIIGLLIKTLKKLIFKLNKTSKASGPYIKYEGFIVTRKLRKMHTE